MYTNRPFFGSRSNAKFVVKILRPVINNFLLGLLFALTLAAISKIGFHEQDSSVLSYIGNQYYSFLSLAAILYLARVIVCVGFRSYTIDFIIFLGISLLIFSTITFNIDKNISWLNNHYFYSLLVFGLFVFEFSRFDVKRASLVLNPAQLLMASFGLIIFVGSLLLMLPTATTQPIKYIDALFTSTSAVCVTGLTVLDTSKDFTIFGKSIILLLFQAGGIGIMTFTSFFGYFFKGNSSSFSEKLVLSDFFSEDNISEIGKTLIKVILFTLVIEAIGSIFIFFSLDTDYFASIEQRIYFSVFHSVSAFCNAGFSTLSSGIYDISTRSSVPLLYSLSFLIILGGIGFPILLNLYAFLKIKLNALFSMLFRKQKKAIIPQIININTRLVVLTTIFLLGTGTFFFYLFENNGVLSEMGFSDKIAHAFFGSVTPRTAGFNSVNYASLSVATIALTIFLMWVGASPVSAGGGIKTSTFAIAVLNTMRIARMKNHIEFHKREIHERSVDRAFAIIILSILILGSSSLLLYLIEPQHGALNILFECVSAFSTVGLSLGITPALGSASKVLLICLMFVGRMGVLTLLFAVFRRTRAMVYRFPKENIVIN
ncbi:MAG: ATPase [Bacteroidales bacterium]|nr:ATPase [Bacteroidales bacterium]